jgi:hypothetical protein
MVLNLIASAKRKGHGFVNEEVEIEEVGQAKIITIRNKILEQLKLLV